MKNYRLIIATLLCAFLVQGCATVSRDLSRTLRYVDGRPVKTGNIDFRDLQNRKRGESCTWNLLMVLPLFGDSSTISAADQGNINNIELIGETGTWYFPLNKSCTVVYGDGNNLPLSNTDNNQHYRLNSDDGSQAASDFWQ